MQGLPCRTTFRSDGQRVSRPMTHVDMAVGRQARMRLTVERIFLHLVIAGVCHRYCRAKRARREDSSSRSKAGWNRRRSVTRGSRARIISPSRRRRHAVEDCAGRERRTERGSISGASIFRTWSSEWQCNPTSWCIGGIGFHGGRHKMWWVGEIRGTSKAPIRKQGNKDGRNGEGESWMHGCMMEGATPRRDCPVGELQEVQGRCFLLLEAVQRCTVFGGIYPALAPKWRAAAPPKLSITVRSDLIWKNTVRAMHPTPRSLTFHLHDWKLQSCHLLTTQSLSSLRWTTKTPRHGSSTSY